MRVVSSSGSVTPESNPAESGGGEKTRVAASLRGLRADAFELLPSSGKARLLGGLLAPCGVDLRFSSSTNSSGPSSSSAKGEDVTTTTDARVAVSTLRATLTPDGADLLSRLADSIARPLAQPPASAPLAACARFERVWAGGSTSFIASNEGLAFWRPVPPIGYASLGDVATRASGGGGSGRGGGADFSSSSSPSSSSSWARPPPFRVAVVALNSGLLAPPTDFVREWTGGGVALWRPVPPPGFVALGCVASPVSSLDDSELLEPPPRGSVACVAAAVCVAARPGPCFPVVDPFALEAASVSASAASSASAAGADAGHVGGVGGGEEEENLAARTAAAAAATAHVWCVSNAAATFDVSTSSSSSSCAAPEGAAEEEVRQKRPLLFRDLRSPIGVPPAALAELSPAAAPSPYLGGETSAARRPLDAGAVARRRARPSPAAAAFLSARRSAIASAAAASARASAADFRRIWWEPPPLLYSSSSASASGSSSSSASLSPGATAAANSATATTAAGVSIWRPVPPPGYASLGDVCVAGREPPPCVVVLIDSQEATVGSRPHLLRPPLSRAARGVRAGLA